MEPQYGNGLSGVINQALREGGTQVSGSLDYQNSSIPGALGSKADELRGYNLFRGYLGGPVPGTAARLRYAISGQLESGAAQVLKFDNDVTSFTNPQQRPAGSLVTDPLDIIAGWRAFGGRQNQQFLGKLTFLPFANGNTKVNATVIDQQRQAQNYDRRYLLTYAGDPWNRSVDIIDSLGFAGQRNFRDILQTSVRDETRMYVGSLQQRFGRSTLNLSGARLEGQRESCNLFLGVCINSPFTIANFRESFLSPFAIAEGAPFQGTGSVFGGEDYSTNTLRADVQSQVTDHHNLQVGAWFVQHDISYNEVRALGGNSGLAATVPQLYRAKPKELSTYLQDRIEYDFLTVRLGFRYDYGKAEGQGFANPQNPTNGTTAREICEQQFGGVTACTGDPNKAPNGKPLLLDSAARLAQLDDFKEADPRTAFSPRIGVSFPLTERSQIFFNAGRYTMNPLYANVYRNTGIGVIAGTKGEGGDNFCTSAQVKPGTNECVPPLAPNNPDYIGNPNLKLEEATQYEVGYAGEFGRAYAVNVAVYNRDESGLSGLRKSSAGQDIGTTYAGQASP